MWFKLAKQIVTSKNHPGPKGGTAFIAFWLPRNARPVMRHIDDLDDDLHMTVVFITEGVETPADRVLILRAVQEVSEKYGPRKCKFTELGMMRNGDNTLVANINIDKGAEFYADLVRSIGVHWKEFDRKYDFVPHCSIKYNNPEGVANMKDLRSYKWDADELVVQFKTNGKKHKFKLIGDY